MVISSSIQIRSEDVTLVGNRKTFTFQQDIQPSSAHSSNPPNQASTKVTSEQTQKVNECREIAANFMFEVTNSTFSISSVNTIVTSGQTGICLIAGSTVRFSESSIACNDYLSPIMIKTSQSEGTNLGSTVVLSYVTHHSASGHIAPFVGMIHPQTSSNTSPNWSDLPTAEMESINIVGTGLSLDSKHLFAGTGPLFSFGLSETDTSLAYPGCLVRMETNLIQSSLKNVTSSSPFSPGNPLFGSEVSQRVAGSCVRENTNHDSGTGMMSPNLGGCLMCLNTSFSSCIRKPNTALDFSFEHQTPTHLDRLDNVSNAVTSVTFTLCTFFELTVETEPGFGGGAILVEQTTSSLTVRTCFFHSCTATGIGDDGGAIRFKCDDNY
ncbi:hypothetical protein BLNAU_21608 [Blattamonas nauphoetae]|uniref:Uncharacterized protein n=1 Tax=Blattamonas nauphoetae TaxID=2049346 RepID=A0ABQ9WVE5_9EUKA|nr:hypothetical protein BLNAU_21608 [Blattamonas nauphoetae]